MAAIQNGLCLITGNYREEGAEKSWKWIHLSVFLFLSICLVVEEESLMSNRQRGRTGHYYWLELLAVVNNMHMAERNCQKLQIHQRKGSKLTKEGNQWLQLKRDENYCEIQSLLLYLQQTRDINLMCWFSVTSTVNHDIYVAYSVKIQSELWIAINGKRCFSEQDGVVTTSTSRG